MKRLVLSVSFFAFLLTGCQVEQLNPVDENLKVNDVETTEYRVSYETSTETRTTYLDGTPVWAEGDKMNVFFGIDNNNSQDKNYLELVDGENTNTGVFRGPYIASNVDDDALHSTVIVYPYDLTTTCDPVENTSKFQIGLTVPSVQKYVVGSFDNGAFPMVGVTANPREVIIQTKNVLSALKLQITGSDEKSISKIELYSDDVELAGPAIVTASHSDFPSIELKEDATKTVELICDTPVQLSNEVTEFFVTFVPCNAKLYAKIYDTEGGYMIHTVTDDYVDYDRNVIYPETVTYNPTKSVASDLSNAFINGGDYTLPMSITYKRQVVVSNKSVNIDLNGHTLTLNYAGGKAGAIQVAKGGILKISNGSITRDYKDGTLFRTHNFNPETDLFELNNVVVNLSTEVYFMSIQGRTNTILNNVTLNGTKKSFGFEYYTKNDTYDRTSSSIVINGGKYKVGQGTIFGNIADYDIPVTFTGNPIFADDSYPNVTWNLTGDEEYPWTPGDVFGAVVNGQSFVNVQEAIQHAISTGVEEVKLVADVNLTSSIVIGAQTRAGDSNVGDSNVNVTIDLNGKTIKCEESDVFVVESGTLTLNGNGVVWGSENNTSSSCAVWAKGTGKVIINGGTYKVGHDGESKAANSKNWRNDCIYVRDNASVVINGGEFAYTGDFDPENNESNGHMFLLNCRDANYTDGTAKIEVKGGKFYKFNPADNSAEGANTNFVVDGYSSVAEGDYFVVSKGIMTEAALNAAIAAGGVVTLDEDITLTKPVIVTNDVKVNLNGKTLTAGKFAESNGQVLEGDTDSYVFWVKGGTLTVEGEGTVKAVDAEYSIAVWANGGNAVLNGGTYENGGVGCDLVYLSGTSSVEINGGVYKATLRGNAEGTANKRSAINIKDQDRAKCSVSVKGGKFYEFNPANNVSEETHTNFTANNTMVAVSEVEGVKIYEVIDLSNGYTMTNNVEIATPIVINTPGSISFNLGSYALTNMTAYDYDNCGETECYVFDVQAGILNVSGNGSVNAVAGADYDMSVFVNGTGKANIAGGKFTNLGKENDGCDLIYVRDKASVSITGGEFAAGNKSSDVGGQYVALNMRDADRKAGTCSIVVTGGKFFKFDPANNVSEENPTNFVAAGYSSVKGENDTYVVSEGILNETALKAAIAAGSTEVTLGGDITLTDAITIDKNITIDLGDNTIKCEESDVFVVESGTLTLNGNGVVWGSENNTSSSCAVWAKGTGKVIINGGTYKVGHDGKSKAAGSKNWRNDCIYVRDNASVVINGGEFAYTGDFDAENNESNGHMFLLNCFDKSYTDGTAKIEVKGGKFFKFNPANNLSEGPNTNFVAAGYSSVKDKNDTYEVSILNETDLKAAIAAGSTEVTLGGDITLTDAITIDKDITIDLGVYTIKCEESDVFVVESGTLTLNGNGVVWGSKNNTSSSCAVWAKGTGKVIINGGTYKVGHDGESKAAGSKNWRNDCIYVRDKASVVINGGEFAYTGDFDPENNESNGHMFLLNMRDEDRKAGTCSIVVTGGKFYEFNPANNSAEGDNTNFVADGYSVKVVGTGVYEVVKE